jgi:hypothetical protein
MPWVEFENTIPAFERVKEVHPLDRPATVVGTSCLIEAENVELSQVKLACNEVNSGGSYNFV